MNYEYQRVVNAAKARKRKRREARKAAARNTEEENPAKKQHSVRAIRCTYCDKPGHNALQCAKHAADRAEVARNHDEEVQRYCVGTGMTQQQPADSEDDAA